MDAGGWEAGRRETGGVGGAMVGSDNGSALRAPLLGECVDAGKESVNANGEVVVVVGEAGEAPQRGYSQSESGGRRFAAAGQAEVNFDTPELATQSRNAFAQIHQLNRQRSEDLSRLPVSRSKRRRHEVRNPIHKKSFVARAAYSFKTDTLNFLYNVLIGLYMWPKWSWDSMKANNSLAVLSAKQGAHLSLINHQIPCPYSSGFGSSLLFRFSQT